MAFKSQLRTALLTVLTVAAPILSPAAMIINIQPLKPVSSNSMTQEQIKQVQQQNVINLMQARPQIQGLQRQGPSGSGGGDEFTLDFVNTASELVPWLVTNGSQLTPPVRASEYLAVIDPTLISSQDHVFESCDDSNTGREVDICFNAPTGKFFISRTRYPLTMRNSPAKRGLVAHEIFRKLGIEGDQYEVSKQIPLLSQPSSKLDPQACTSIHESMAQIISIYIDSFKSCYQLGSTGKADSQAYQDSAQIARQIESTYANARVSCEEVCADATSCNGPAPAGACNGKQ